MSIFVFVLLLTETDASLYVVSIAEIQVLRTLKKPFLRESVNPESFCAMEKGHILSLAVLLFLLLARKRRKQEE